MIGTRLEQVCLVASVALPLLGAALVKARHDERAGVGVSWAGAVASLCTLALVAGRGPVQVGVGGPSAHPWTGLVADPVTASLLVVICGVGALVQSFQSRYLQADPCSARFAARSSLVVAAMATVTTSATLGELIVAWVGAGTAFVAVLCYRQDLPGTAAVVRSARRSLIVGDGCLVAAGVLVWLRAGNVALAYAGTLERVGPQLGDWRDAVAILVVVASLARCAQAFFRRWLSLSVSSPTPASALLHAGVVNGGGILMIRLGGFAAWPPAMAALLALSAGTAVWAGAVMTHQPDVKGRLAASTASQMGFMLAEIAVGAWPAAVVHMIGHGLYKSSMFFSSGSAVTRPGSPSAVPVEARSGRTVAGALAGAVAAAAVLPGVATGDGWVVALYAGAGAAVLAASWWAHRPRGTTRWIWPAGLVAAGGAYGGVVAATAHFLSPALPRPPGLGTAWLLAPAAAAALATLLSRAGTLGMSLRLQLVRAGTPGAGRRATLGGGVTRDRGLPALVRPSFDEPEAA